MKMTADKLPDDNFAEEFRDMDFSAREIVSKEFEECTFVNCDFRDAKLLHCVFEDCRFLRCDMGVMKIEGSRFTDAVFEDCKMSGVDWTKARYSDIISAAPMRFLYSVLDYSSFYGLGLQELEMRGCRVEDVDFRECDLSGADLRESDFSKSLFRNTDLSGADFTLAQNYTIDINVNTIKGAKFSRYEAIRLLEGLDITLVD